MKINVSNPTKPQQDIALRTLTSGVYLCGPVDAQYIMLWDKILNLGYMLGRAVSQSNTYAGVNTVENPVAVKIDSIDVSVL